jgi:hypothetical protein
MRSHPAMLRAASLLIPTSCYSASRWHYLDPSWSSLAIPARRP